MQIVTLRLANFQSFGPAPTEISLDDLTYVLGPNGAGKTTVLEALSRLFSPLPAQRRIVATDFHVPLAEAQDSDSYEPPMLWLEVDIQFAEAQGDEVHPSVPPFFAHMALDDPDGPPGVRIRLSATLEPDGYVDERIEYVLEVDEDGAPTRRAAVSRTDRAYIEVHYLPARRDPSEHISYATASLLGRTLRAADWSAERESLSNLGLQITEALGKNAAVGTLGVELTEVWAGLHRGAFFKDPAIGFGHSELEGVLRQLTVTFTPSHGGLPLPYERLSDGQKSLLYMSLVLSWQTIARRVASGEDTSLDATRLRPPVHTVIAIEEPENSLSSQYLGRILKLLREACAEGDVQGLIATHAPALLRRVAPESIRFLRLDEDRRSTVRTVVLPTDSTEAAKYVREAVEAFPELYFSRLVVLGEGDSEQVVMPRVLAATGIAEDDASVSVVPLGGRHVHHFWRLLDTLDIPHVTLLDLDCARHGGGWGRVRYVVGQINRRRPGTFSPEQIAKLSKWDEDVAFPKFKPDKGAVLALERRGVFFSYPVDLDLMMLAAYPDSYDVERSTPTESRIEAVLGRGRANVDRLGQDVVELFDTYHRQFNLGSKPASHIAAMAVLDDDELFEGLPGVLGRLVEAVRARLASIPE